VQGRSTSTGVDGSLAVPGPVVLVKDGFHSDGNRLPLVQADNVFSLGMSPS
jgi:hypothetical protein